MPELPEVETVRRLLTRRIIGAVIEGAAFPSASILKNITPEAFTKSVQGTQITEVGRRGKYLLLQLRPTAAGEVSPSHPLELVVHLKMRGSLRAEPADETPGRYLCASLRLNQNRELRYYDMWRWGEWNLLEAGTAETTLPGLKAMGPEPFAADFTPERFAERLGRRRGAVKPLLLEQRVVAGLGNIYCDESLHRARLHPSRTVQSLSAEEISRLYTAFRAVLETAIAQGGAYAEQQAKQQGNIETFEGVYTPQVYDNPGKPCPVCGENLIKFQLHGRGTTYCPRCQPGAEIPAGQDTGHFVPAERSDL